jgi:hypothetical protein
MRLEHYAAAAVLLALAGCGGAERKNDAKADQSASGAPAASAPVAARLNPGQWEVTVDSSALSAPGMPAQVASMMKNMKISTQHCITPEEASRPTSHTFGGKSEGDCKQSEFSVDGGTIHSVMSCSGAGGKDGTTITADGHYGGDSYDIRSRMVTDTGHGEMTAESHIAGRRIGECKAG